jgi:site-specific DNA recombinase
MKRAIAYLRVSTEKQVKKELDPDGMSLPVQKEYATEKAAQLGAFIEEFYIDRGQSARSMRRDDLQRMCKRLREGERVDYVIVLSVNRLARDVGDFDRIWDDVITKAGAELVSVLETFDNSPSGRFMAHVLAAKAEYDSAQTAERVKLGMQRKAQIGGTTGRAPIGYRNVVSMVDGRPVKLVDVDPDRAPLITEGFELYATGDWSMRELLDHLTEQGLRTRAGARTPSKPLALSQVHKVLTNPYYCGQVSLHGAIYKGRHDALVTRQLFDRVQTVLGNHLNGERRRVHSHFLKGLVFCHRCKSHMTLQVSKGYVYYFCKGRSRRNGCDQPYLAIEAVEKAVEHEFAHLTIPETDIEAARDELQSYLSTEQSERAAAAQRQRLAITKLDDERSRLLQAHLAEAVPLDLLKREQARIARELQAAEIALAAAEVGFADVEAVFDRASKLLVDPQGYYASAVTDEGRRNFTLVFFERLELDGERIGDAQLTRPMAALIDAVRGGGPTYRRAAAPGRDEPIQAMRLTILPASSRRYTQNPSLISQERVLLSAIWSGRRESNSRSQLGKLMFCR